MSLLDVLLPQSIELPSPSFTHICWDAPEVERVFKGSEEYRKYKAERLRKWRAKKRG